MTNKRLGTVLTMFKKKVGVKKQKGEQNAAVDVDIIEELDDSDIAEQPEGDSKKRGRIQ